MLSSTKRGKPIISTPILQLPSRLCFEHYSAEVKQLVLQISADMFHLQEQQSCLLAGDLPPLLARPCVESVHLEPLCYATSQLCSGQYLCCNPYDLPAVCCAKPMNLAWSLLTTELPFVPLNSYLTGTLFATSTSTLPTINMIQR